MRKVGVREAKARLSELLKDVENGNEWTITARGRPIARLIRVPKQETVQEWVARLEKEGRLISPPPGAHWPPRPLKVAKRVGKLAQKWLREGRDGKW